jgi:hypothetical protein
MNRWVIRLVGIMVLLVLFMMMIQMLNTLQRLAATQQQSAPAP